jgi:hypothetical protein
MNKLETIEAFYGNLTPNSTFTLDEAPDSPHPFKATLTFWETDPEWRNHISVGLQGDHDGAHIDTLGDIETVHVSVFGEQPADMMVALYEACERIGAWAWNQRKGDESK